MKNFQQFINEINQNNLEFDTNISNFYCVYSKDLKFLEQSKTTKDSWIKFSEIFKYKNYFYYLSNYKQLDYNNNSQIKIGAINLYRFINKSSNDYKRYIENFINNGLIYDNFNYRDDYFQWYAMKEQYLKIINKFHKNDYIYFLENNIEQDNYNSKLMNLSFESHYIEDENSDEYEEIPTGKFNWSWDSVDNGSMFIFILDDKNHKQFIKDLPSMKIETIDRDDLVDLIKIKYNGEIDMSN